MNRMGAGDSREPGHGSFGFGQVTSPVDRPETAYRLPELSLPVGPGLLDYREALEAQIEIMAVAGGRIATAMAIFNRQTRDSKLAIAAMGDRDLARLSTKQRKMIANNFARQMTHMATALKAELPKFSSAVDEGFGAMRGIAELLTDAAPTNEDLEENARVLIGYRSGLKAAIESTEEYRRTFSLLPNLTRELNSARIEATTVLGKLIEKLFDGLQLTEDTLAKTVALLGTEK